MQRAVHLEINLNVLDMTLANFFPSFVCQIVNIIKCIAIEYLLWKSLSQLAVNPAGLHHVIFFQGRATLTKYDE